MARYVLLTQRAELVFDQSVATWLRLHRVAFEFFGGVPRRVVLDNLRAAIVHAALYDPEVQRSYRECAEHYGFLIAPCRPRTPEHKGKVEQGGVHYVKRNALAGRAFRDLHDGNRHLLRWCVETAGHRVHGTTKRIPLDSAMCTSHRRPRSATAARRLAGWAGITDTLSARRRPNCASPPPAQPTGEPRGPQGYPRALRHRLPAGKHHVCPRVQHVLVADVPDAAPDHL